MSGLINLIILYIIFSSFSSFVKKLKQQQAQQQGALKKPGEVSRPQPKKILEQVLEEVLAVPQPKEPPPLDDILELDDDEIEFHQEEAPADMPVVELPSLPKVSPTPNAASRPSASLLDFDGESYTKGIILAEILGPPVSRRQSRRGL